MMHWLQALRYYAEDQLLSDLKRKHPTIGWNVDHITFEDGVVVKLSYNCGVFIERDNGLWILSFAKPTWYTVDELPRLMQALSKAQTVMTALKEANL